MPRYGDEEERILGKPREPYVATEPVEESYINPKYVEDAVEDAVNHPSHYTAHPSGVECIQITEHMNFNLGNALKYIWRCDLKKNDIEDLEKAIFYINREIALRNKE